MTTTTAAPARTEALKGHAAMMGFALGVAGSFSLGAMVADYINPVQINALRFVLAGAVMVAVVLANGGYRRADVAAPWRYPVLAVIFIGYFVLMLEALRTAEPVSISAVYTLMPLLTALMALPILGQRTGWGVAVPLVVGALGAVYVIFRGDLAALAALDIGRGEVIYFIACVLHAVFTPLLRRWNRGESPLVMTSIIQSVMAVLLVAWGWRDLMALDMAALPPIVWITIVYMALISSALCFWFLQYAVVRLPSSKVMAYNYATPVWVILWEVALGHGAPGMVVLPGIAVTLIALALLLRRD